MVRMPGAQVKASEPHNAVSLDRADCHGRKVLSIRIDAQTPTSVIVKASAENLDASRAARGRTRRNANRSARTSVQAAVGDHCGVARVRGIIDINSASVCAYDDRAA